MRRWSCQGGAEVCREEMHASGDHIELAGKHVRFTFTVTVHIF